jgi:hypothetical protein
VTAVIGDGCVEVIEIDSDDSFEEIDTYVRSQLGPLCGPVRKDLCDEAGLAEIEALDALSTEELEKQLRDAVDAVATLDEEFNVFAEELRIQCVSSAPRPLCATWAAACQTTNDDSRPALTCPLPPPRVLSSPPGSNLKRASLNRPRTSCASPLVRSRQCCVHVPGRLPRRKSSDWSNR